MNTAKLKKLKHLNNKELHSCIFTIFHFLTENDWEDNYKAGVAVTTHSYKFEQIRNLIICGLFPDILYLILWSGPDWREKRGDLLAPRWGLAQAAQAVHCLLYPFYSLQGLLSNHEYLSLAKLCKPTWGLSYLHEKQVIFSNNYSLPLKASKFTTTMDRQFINIQWI